MGLFIAVMIVAWMVKSTITDAAYAVRGQTPPRTAARLARQHSGVKSSGRSGLSGYVANLWDDGWQAKTDGRRAKRAQRSADPQPAASRSKRYGVRAHLADRWERAWIDATDRHGQRLAERERMFSPKAPKPVGPTVGGQPVKPEFLQPDPPELWRGDDPADPRLHEWRAGVPHVHGDFIKAPVCPSCGRPMFLNVGGLCANCAGGDGDDWNEDDPRDMQPHRAGDGELVFGDDPTDPNGIKQCHWCSGAGLIDGEPCFACRDRQERRNTDWEQRHPDPREKPESPESPNGGNPTNGTEPMFGSTIIASDAEYAANPPDERGTWVREEDLGDGPNARTTTTTSGNPTTGGTMSTPTGEVVGIESIRTTLDQFNEIAGTAIDSAAQLRTQAEAAAQAAETMAAGMSAGNVHPDTLGDVADMTEAASDARTAAEAAAAAFERLGAASAVARQGVEQRDGLVADVAQSTGNAADREVLMN